MDIGRLLLEVAASYVVPALVNEANSYILRRAVQRAASTVFAPKPRIRRLRLVPLTTPPRAVTVMSAIPGRVRFSVASMHGDSSEALSIESLLSGLSGVDQVRSNPTTGGVLVAYNPCQTTVERIQNALTE